MKIRRTPVSRSALGSWPMEHRRPPTIDLVEKLLIIMGREELGMKYGDALKQAISNKAGRDYPNSTDVRSRMETVFPTHRPKFNLGFTPGQTVFTIGSCFARNVEESLANRRVFLPTMTFSAPSQEWAHRPNGLLNEYNPGTISQRILFAIGKQAFPKETIVPSGDLYADLLLPGGADVTFERALERRSEIDTVYGHLSESSIVIITLGLVEAWFDNETELFLNRIPPHVFANKNKNRFIVRRLDVFECLPLLEKAVNALVARGIKLVLTVSPVPLGTTFMQSDCIVANEFSKAVLRVCAERLQTVNALVDYFPSYEIVRSCGMRGYLGDQIHVRDELVGEIMRYMVSSYGTV